MEGHLPRELSELSTDIRSFIETVNGTVAFEIPADKFVPIFEPEVEWEVTI